MLDSDVELFASALLLERGMSRNTITAYGTDLRSFVAYLRRRKVETAPAIRREDIVDYIRNEREKGLSARTRARRTAAIRMFLRFLKERRVIASDPSELMDAPRKGLVLPRVLSEAEMRRMIEEVKGEAPREVRDRALLEVLYGCGLRVSEACALRMEDLVGDGELLRILGKGSKERLVPVTGPAGRALTDYFSSARGAFVGGNLAETHVFVTRLGRPFTRQGVFKVVRERAANAGIAPDRVSPHVLRHTYASHLLSRGADIRVIQELLGHADIGTTQVYTHVDAATFGEVHRKHHPRADF